MRYTVVYGEELYHHGIKGQKWGVRRFQNEDGSLTPAGRERYGVDRIGRNIGRAILAGSVGQRLAVNLNKGYREDKKLIKAETRQNLKEIRKSDSSFQQKALRVLSKKHQRKQNLAEARVAAANANYSWQSDEMNRKIQTQNLGKQFVKSVVLSDYGALNYDRLRGSGYSKLTSAGAGFISGWANVAIGGGLGTIDYAYNKAGDVARRRSKKTE